MKRLLPPGLITGLLLVVAVTCTLHEATAETRSDAPEGPAATRPVDGTDLVVPKGTTQGTIDGTASGDDYAPAQSFTNGAGTFRVQAYRDPSTGDEELQLLVTVSDGTDSDNDYIRIYFDVDHDHASPDPLDRQIEITRAPSVDVGEANLNGSPNGPISLPSGQWTVDPTGGQWVAEVKILPSDLDLNVFPSLMGLYVEVFNNETVDTERYPSTAFAASDVGSWANLKTRYPLDYMVVLDQSGSMLSDDKWTDATQAANFLANTMSVFRDPTYFDDRIGVVTFDWDCSGSNETSVEEPLAVLGNVLVGDYTSGLAAPESSNCTPIASGMSTAFGTMNASQGDDAVGRERAVLLLSDGLHNRPDSDFDPSDTGYDPCGTSGWGGCPSEISNVPVSTVAFGSGDWGVDTDLLADVTTRYQGGFADEFNLVGADGLKDVFVQNIAEYYDANLIKDDAATSFPLTSSNAKLLVIASWDNPGDAEDIELEVGGSTPSCTPSGSDTSVGFGVCVVEAPAVGTWTVSAVGGGAFGSAPDQIFVLVDLRVRARFALDRVTVPTGAPTRLTVGLRDRGQPVLHDAAAHPVRVTAEVSRPGEAVGTFASTNEPQTCEARDPVLPRRDLKPRDAARAVPELPGPFAASQFQVQRGSDPDPPLFQLMATLLEACGRTGLTRGSAPDLVLVDDGTQGDEAAGDGVYTALYDDTEIEGTYVFRFAVDGTTSDGEAFVRTKRLSAYVGVAPTAANSVLGSRVIGQQAGQVVREFYVLPRDRFGGYLGPGKSRVVRFAFESGTGTLVGPDVVDYGNGYYSRFVRHPEGEIPVVTPVIRGERLVPEDGGGVAGAELGIFASRTIFDDDLVLEDGWGLGGHIGAPLFGQKQLFGEIEIASTLTNITSADTVRLAHAMGSVRLDLVTTQPRRLAPFVAVGAGMGRVWGEGRDETLGLLHGSAGVSYFVSRRVGLRLTGRALRLSGVRGADPTVNLQILGGVVFRLRPL